MEEGCSLLITVNMKHTNGSRATLKNHPTPCLECACRSISKLCDETREDIGMSVAELARRIGVDRKRLWYVLNGQRQMRADEFLKICIALRTDPKRFISRDMIEGVHEHLRH